MLTFNHLFCNQIFVLNTFNIPSDFYTSSGSITFKNSDSYNKNDNTHLNILIVEDEEACRLTLQMMFMGTNHNIILANGGNPCMSYLIDHAAYVDLVILDLMMPDLHGTCVAHLMKKVPSMQDIPILISTGSEDDIEIKGAMSSAENLIKKPYNRVQLINAISGFKSRRK